jgi:hypothetical protein
MKKVFQLFSHSNFFIIKILFYFKNYFVELSSYFYNFFLFYFYYKYFY